MKSLKHELVLQLEKIPGIEHVPCPDRDDGFSVLNFRGKEIGHFHNFNEIDLRLGKQLIRQEGLKHPADSSKHPKRSPNSPFIELRFHHQRDISKVVHLVGLLVSKHLN
ncbi:MAG: DUF5519 family protein [Pseudomonadales bacterium]|nr:DUF5519 family protein [Pseudomonadales bacterium]